jgi:hypothetical protein
MPVIKVIYPNEKFGYVTLHINDILIGNLEANQSIDFEVYNGENTIRIKLSGTSSTESVHALTIKEDTVLVVEGYLSKKRLIAYAIPFVPISVYSYFYASKTKTFPFFAFGILVALILFYFIHGIYYLVIQKKPQVYFVAFNSARHNSLMKNNITKEYINHFKS